MLRQHGHHYHEEKSFVSHICTEQQFYFLNRKQTINISYYQDHLLSVQISDALRKNKILLNCPPQERSLFSLQNGWPHKKGTAV
jgi:hypothetical protein